VPARSATNVNAVGASSEAASLPPTACRAPRLSAEVRWCVPVPCWCSLVLHAGSRAQATALERPSGVRQ